MSESLQEKMTILKKTFQKQMTAFEADLAKAQSATSVDELTLEYTQFRSNTLEAIENLNPQIDVSSRTTDSMEKRSRRKMMVLYGIPELQEEIASEVLVKVFSDHINSTISTTDIRYCCRMGQPSADHKPRPIMVKFKTVKIRDSLWFSKSKLKGSGIKVSEFLSKEQHQIFMVARKIFGPKKCWTRKGVIHIIARDGVQKRIVSISELKNIVCQDTKMPTILIKQSIISGGDDAQKKKKMEAVVFDGKALSLKYQKDYPVPQIESDDDVIVKIEYSGICGTDLHIIQGEFPASKVRPLPLGHESSGVIHAVGKNSVFKVGQKVAIDPNTACYLCDFCRDGNYHYCLTAGINSTVGIFRDGAWAEYCRVPQHQIFPLPDGITTEQAGLTEPYSCVAHGFDRASPIHVGKKILIIGAGIIGNLWVTTLHHHGHRDVTVSEMNKTRLEIVKGLNTGFRLVTPDVLEKEKTLYDVIIDCTGVGKVMETSFNYIKEGGKYVLFGCCPPTHQASLNPFQIYNKELTIIGVKINPFSFPNALGWIKAMGDRYLNYKKLGVKTYRLSEYQSAIDDLKAGTVAKAIFKLTPD